MGLSILPRPDGFSEKPGENHSALHLLSICFKSQFPRKIISISSPTERNTFYKVLEIQLRLGIMKKESQKPDDNRPSSSQPQFQISISLKDYFHFLAKEINTVYKVEEIQSTNWEIRRWPLSLCFKSQFPWKIISISSPCFASHFLFLPDPWYLLRCRWMVGNSDGSVIETYSPDPAQRCCHWVTITKFLFLQNFHRDRCLCRPNGRRWVSQFLTWNIQAASHRFRSVSHLSSKLVNGLPN